MNQNPIDPDQQIRLRRAEQSRARIDIHADELDAIDLDGIALIRERSEQEVASKNAALLVDGERVPVPSYGIAVGNTPDCAVQAVVSGAGPVQATIENEVGAHVIFDSSGGGRIFVNGERLAQSERRPLQRADSIAVGGTLLHYLPAGVVQPDLTPVAPVDAGRLRTSKAEFVIGRAGNSDLLLDHPTVSLRHACVRMQSGRAEIESIGGAVLRVNGAIVRRGRLKTGDQIAIGPFRIIFDGEDLIERSTSGGLSVVAHDVSVQVEDTTILQPTNISLRPGELVALIGESGAGKSTLLNALAGVSQPSGGAVMIGGEPVANRLPELGYVPQFDIVHGQLTVREALDYAARLRLPTDTSESDRQARVNQVIAQLGLSERADIRVDRLSGGQRKRAAVGIELLHRPGALFLDEPTTGLDPGLERQLMLLLRSFADAGQTVVLVTHATGSIAMCDRVILMGRGGRVRFDGRPPELLDSFGINSFDEVYTESADANEQIHRRRRRLRFDDAATAQMPPLQTLAPRREQIQQPFGYQTRVLTSRYMTLVARDRKHLRSAMLQVPILGLLTAMLFTSKVFTRDPTEYASKSATLLFLMVMIAAWLGSINAAREIVKERSVLARELAVGVRIEAYLASKLSVLFCFVSAQILVFSLIVLTLRPLNESFDAVLQLNAVLLLTGSVAILLGLLVSAYAANEDQATGVIPLLLVPQMLLAGAIVSISDMTPLMRVVAAAVPARWSFASAGNSIELQSRIDSDKVFAPISRYGDHFFNVNVAAFIAISAVFAGALLFAIVRLLEDPKSK